MEALYQMKLLIRENPLFHRPEIVPIRVLRERRTERPLRVHVICGGDGAVKIKEELDDRGYALSAGVVNIGSSDCEICRYLQIPHVEIPPLYPGHAGGAGGESGNDAGRGGDPGFGYAVRGNNLMNLEGLEQMKGRIFFHKNALSGDYPEADWCGACRNWERRKRSSISEIMMNFSAG